MSKRFTDTKKWMNPWFSALPLEAKLTWIYLCDECDLTGVIEVNYPIASVQLGFDITPKMLPQWYDNKIFFFDNTKLLLIQFFEFQYGLTKNTWSAKIQAKEKLEALGFYLEKNSKGLWYKVSDPNKFFRSNSPPQYDHSGGTPLNTGTSKGISTGEGKEEGVFDFETEVFKIYATIYPLKKGYTEALVILRPQIISFATAKDLETAATNYLHSLKPKDYEYIKKFDTFANEWRDWLMSDAGKVVIKSKRVESTKSNFEPMPFSDSQSLESIAAQDPEFKKNLEKFKQKLNIKDISSANK